MTLHSWRDGVEGLRADLHGVVGGRLRALVVYEAHGLLSDSGSGADAAAAVEPGIRHDHQIHTLAIVDDLEYGDLARLAPLSPNWSKRGLAIPLFLSPDELARSMDAFPLEFSQILARHVVVIGDDPFRECAVLPDDVRRACETQARSHLVHLREGFVQSAGDPRALASLVAASVIPLRALLLNMARLDGVHARTPEALSRFAEDRLRLPMNGLRSLLSDKPAQHFATSDVGEFFPAYLAAVERLVEVVDEWQR